MQNLGKFIQTGQYHDQRLMCGQLVECPWHYGTFDVTTGAPVSLPCSIPLKTYPVQLEGDDVYVRDEN